MLDIKTIRSDFPALQQTVHGKPLVYLDNAASTQKPQSVIDAINQVYSRDYSNVHRGVHTLSERATAQFEAARTTMQHFINAKHAHEIIFVRGTTEAINLVAHSYGRSHIGKGDEILITEMEHHANIVPWQLLCEQTGAKLVVVPITDLGEIDQRQFKHLLNKKTALLAITHISNAIGTINPIQSMIATAHQHNVPVLVDGAQGIVHNQVDVQALDCDFYTISGHKFYGPTGIGILYGKETLLNTMQPYQGGGEMISQVTFEKTTYAPLPHKFEAGTPHIAGAIGLASACDYIHTLGLDNIAHYEQQLLDYATTELQRVPGLHIVGKAPAKASIISFTLDNIHAHDIGTILDHAGVAVRSGHHCAMPIMQRYGVAATARAALSFYNTPEEIDILVRGLHTVREVFKQ